MEDERPVADLIQDTLRAAGHECLLARDAADADRMLSTHAVDGITLDVRIPGRDGLDWLAGLFTLRPELARRTLVITGTALSPADCGNLARCGASLLAKPFEIEDLMDTISKQLSPSHER